MVEYSSSERFGESFDEDEAKEFAEEKPLTFDDMVSFAMFAEVSLVVISIIMFLFYFWLTR